MDKPGDSRIKNVGGAQRRIFIFGTLFQIGGPLGGYVMQISTTCFLYIHWTSCSNS